MKRRHQGRAFAAGGDVAAAKIGDDVDAQTLRNDVGITDLQRKGRIAQRLMQYRLAVAADGAHLVGRQSAGSQELRGSLRKLQPHGGVELAQLAQTGVLEVLSRVTQSLLQLRGPLVLL